MGVDEAQGKGERRERHPVATKWHTEWKVESQNTVRTRNGMSLEAPRGGAHCDGLVTSISRKANFSVSGGVHGGRDTKRAAVLRNRARSPIVFDDRELVDAWFPEKAIAVDEIQ
jgi:hypothetical protein